MNVVDFKNMKQEIQQKTKCGVDFILAASIVWMLIFIVWSLEKTPTGKSILTFIVGSFLIPIALIFSKLIGTQWQTKNNPLAPLGLWLNISQLIYFPFLFFFFYKDPQYFIMAYAIITGAHLFPFGWFYDHFGYPLISIIISLGSFVLIYITGSKFHFIIPIYTALALLILGICLITSSKSFKQNDSGRITPEHT